MVTRFFPLRGLGGRWLVANADNDMMAWTGSRWTGIDVNGFPIGPFQVSNFAEKRDAEVYGLEFGFEPVTYRVTDDRSITCLVCQRTSYNVNDVANRYCAYCHLFHNGAHRA